MGQAIADVLQSESAERDIADLLTDLTQSRDHPTDGSETAWQPVLSALLGVVRQYVHRRELDEAAGDPSNASVRARILLAIQAGARRPTDIAKTVGSPPTVVSRALRILVEDGDLRGPSTDPNDGRFRIYELSAGDQGSVVPGRNIVEFRSTQTEAARDARSAARVKPAFGLPYVSTLNRVGADRAIDAAVRADSLSAACMVLRSNRALTEARTVAEQISELGDDTGDDFIQAVGLYEIARTTVEDPEGDRANAFDLLTQADALLKGQESNSAAMQRAWILYSKAVFTPTGLSAAVDHLFESRTLFGQTQDRYGESACDMVLARFYAEKLDFSQSLQSARRGFEFADGGNFVRLTAECALWMGSAIRVALLSGVSNHESPVVYLELAERRFGGLGLASWAAIAQSELVLHGRLDAQSLQTFGPENEKLVDACSTIESLAQLVHDLPGASSSWAAASLYRRVGVLCRLSGRFEHAVRWFDLAYRIHETRRDLFGMSIALAGKRSAQHSVFELSMEAMYELPSENGRDTLNQIMKDPALELHMV
ncbi:ArsR family transcriptional regulator [Rhodococcus sp. P1Y]|nr:ArsR family transcriptional regulator [Rhodococcus sp. P1Y]